MSKTQKMNFLIKDFFIKCDQIRTFLRIWSHLLKKFFMKNFIFVPCNVYNAKMNDVHVGIYITMFGISFILFFVSSYHYLMPRKVCFCCFSCKWLEPTPKQLFIFFSPFHLLLHSLKVRGFIYTAWKVSVFRAFLIHILPHSDWIRRDNVWMQENSTPENTKTFHVITFPKRTQPLHLFFG